MKKLLSAFILASSLIAPIQANASDQCDLNWDSASSSQIDQCFNSFSSEEYYEYGRDQLTRQYKQAYDFFHKAQFANPYYPDSIRWFVYNNSIYNITKVDCQDNNAGRISSCYRIEDQSIGLNQTRQDGNWLVRFEIISGNLMALQEDGRTVLVGKPL